MNVQLLNEGTRKARKQHQCFHCYRPIWPGETYLFTTCKYDHVYTLAMHPDCSAASAYYQKFCGLKFWDYDAGIPPLADQMRDGDFDLDCAALRGHFPHVITRMEFSEQRAAIHVNEWEMPL